MTAFDKPQSEPINGASVELDRLSSLVGTWRTQGRSIPNNANEPAIEIAGTDSYQWLPGGFFLVHHVDVMMGNEKVNAIEVIGPYDASSQTYPMRSFDHQGNFTTMQASFDADGGWMFVGETVRAHLTIAANGATMNARWEMREGSEWKHWLDMEFSKISG